MEAAIGMEIREHKGSFAVYVVLRVLVIAVAVLEFFNGDYEAVFLCILTLLLLLAPAFVQVRFRIELPSALEVIVLVFVFAAEILGEISSFYEIFPFWDTALHTMNGFLAAAIGFSLVDLLNRSDRVKFELSPLYLAIVSFCFSMTIGVVWEFFEFSMDMMFGFDMQKDAVVHSISSVMLDPAHANHAVHINDITQVAVNGRDLGLGGYLDIGLIDTMEDLIVNFIGAVVFSVIGFIYVKNRGKGASVISRFVPRRKSHDRDYLRLAGGDGARVTRAGSAGSSGATPVPARSTPPRSPMMRVRARPGSNGSTCNCDDDELGRDGEHDVRRLRLAGLAVDGREALGQVAPPSRLGGSACSADALAGLIGTVHKTIWAYQAKGMFEYRNGSILTPFNYVYGLRRWPSSSRGAVSTGGGRSCWSAVSPAACWSSP